MKQDNKFTLLSETEHKSLKLVEGYRDNKETIRLSNDFNHTTIRLCAAMSSDLDPASRVDALLLSKFSIQKGSAYKHMAMIPGAYRWASFMMAYAWQKLEKGSST